MGYLYFPPHFWGTTELVLKFLQNVVEIHAPTCKRRDVDVCAAQLVRYHSEDLVNPLVRVADREEVQGNRRECPGMHQQGAHHQHALVVVVWAVVSLNAQLPALRIAWQLTLRGQALEDPHESAAGGVDPGVLATDEGVVS